MLREEKIKLLRYYQSDKCVCGKPKESEHWLCIECREKFVDTDEAKYLTNTCNAHIKAAYDYIKMVEAEQTKAVAV